MMLKVDDRRQTCRWGPGDLPDRRARRCGYGGNVHKPRAWAAPKAWLVIQKSIKDK
jgi:hypothetical protein